VCVCVCVCVCKRERERERERENERERERKQYVCVVSARFCAYMSVYSCIYQLAVIPHRVAGISVQG
jgi:hypothetical protein